MSASTAAPPQPVPTIDDARAVAEALMSFEQVCEVAVFGSVARAAARPDSDLDLLVVCDDIDYGAQRAALAVRMRETAASVVRWPLDLLVTDRAAWAAWTGLPSTSEAVIAEDAITLQQRPATGPVSRKIVPMSTAAENAASSLERVTSRLRAALQVCAASTEEKQARRAGDEAELNDARMSRWCNTLTECDMVLEHALTSINHSLGGKGAGKTHHLAAIFAKLPEGDARSTVGAALEPLRVEHIPTGTLGSEDDAFEHGFIDYRTFADYGSYTLKEETAARAEVIFTPGLAHKYLQACAAVSEVAVAEAKSLPAPPHAADNIAKRVARASRVVAHLQEMLDTYNPVAGRSRRGWTRWLKATLRSPRKRLAPSRGEHDAGGSAKPPPQMAGDGLVPAPAKIKVCSKRVKRNKHGRRHAPCLLRDGHKGPCRSISDN